MQVLILVVRFVKDPFCPKSVHKICDVNQTGLPNIHQTLLDVKGFMEADGGSISLLIPHTPHRQSILLIVGAKVDLRVVVIDVPVPGEESKVLVLRCRPEFGAVTDICEIHTGDAIPTGQRGEAACSKFGIVPQIA